ncbi:unnamed protein product, partial [Prorocentrum cordatum]
ARQEHAQRLPARPAAAGRRLLPALADGERRGGDMVGSTSRDQMALILNLVGSPSEEEVDEIVSSAGGVIAKTARRYLRSFPHQKPANLAHLFPTSSEEALDLLERLLRFSPQRRVGVEGALAHGFLAGLPPLAQERLAEVLKPVEPLDFEAEELGVAALRRLIWREVCGFCPPAPSERGAPASAEAP